MPGTVLRRDGLLSAVAVALTFGFLTAGTASAHHNPVVYDGKTTVKITGTVVAARFGFPHSRYMLEMADENGDVERWTMMTEDPRDAKALGFDEALKAIERGQTLTVVGWPNKIKEREIRGHQLHYPDGTVVMMRRGNYIWTNDLRRIWRLRDEQIEYPETFAEVSAELPGIDRVLAWVDGGDPVARVAREIQNGTARLVGIGEGDDIDFAGVRDPFECHTKRSDFRLELSPDDLTTAQREGLAAGSGFIRRYNDLLATYWEYDIANCPD